MRYEQLHKLLMDKGTVVFRVGDYPDEIIIPSAGYGVFLPMTATISADDAEASWDAVLDRMRVVSSENGYEWLFLTHQEGLIDFVPMHIARSKDYAVGHAHGSGADSIYDVAKNKEIFLA